MITGIWIVSILVTVGVLISFAVLFVKIDRETQPVGDATEFKRRYSRGARPYPPPIECGQQAEWIAKEGRWVVSTISPPCALHRPDPLVFGRSITGTPS